MSDPQDEEIFFDKAGHQWLSIPAVGFVRLDMVAGHPEHSSRVASMFSTRHGAFCTSDVLARADVEAMCGPLTAQPPNY